jgi:hypothetical protein
MQNKMLKQGGNPSKTLEAGQIVEICHFYICQFFQNKNIIKNT